MCGIVAIICKDSRGLFAFDRDPFEEALLADSVRGRDSTGVFGVSMRNEVHLVKQAIDPGTFMKSPAYKEWSMKVPQYRAIVGHNRKATSGAIVSANAHPFKEGPIVLVHNGMLFNAKEMNSEVEVDSHALCHGFATKGAKETLTEVSGAFALIWYDIKQKEIYLWRNEDRPLSMIETHDKIYIASELDMMKWILTRDKRHFSSTREGMIKPNTLYTMKLDPFKLSEEPLSKKPFIVNPTNGMHEWPRSQAAIEHELAFQEFEEASREAAAAEMDIASAVVPMGPEWRDDPEVSLEHLRNVVNEDKGKQLSPLETRQKYPFGSKVIFLLENIRTYTETPKRYEVRGKIYLPGCPIVDGFIYTHSDIGLPLIKEWKDSRKLIGSVSTVLGLRDGSTVIHLDSKTIQIPTQITTWGKTKFPLLEWQLITNKFKCTKCKLPIHTADHEITSVNERKLGDYNVVCNTCLNEAMAKPVLHLPMIVEASNDSLKGSTHGS